MSEQKYFRHALNAYSHRIAEMAEQIHQACRAHYLGDTAERDRLKAVAKQTCAQATFLWNCVPVEDQKMFAAFIAEIEEGIEAEDE